MAQQSLELAEQAGAGQPDARRGRHDGADRRRAGAGRAGDAAAERWSPAQATRRTAELTLKRLIVAGTEDPNWSATLDPIDRPDFRPEPIDVEAAVRRALSERTDLAIAQEEHRDQRRHAEATCATRRCRRSTCRRSYGVHGHRRHAVHRAAAPACIGSSVTDTIPGGIADAFSSLFGNRLSALDRRAERHLSARHEHAGGARRARARAAEPGRGAAQADRAAGRHRRHQRRDQRRRTTPRRVQAAQAARELAQQQLEAEQSKFEVGMSTNYFVVQAQRDLRDAQNSELRAILNYRKALVELERLQQTTLQNSNITVIKRRRRRHGGSDGIVGGGSGGDGGHVMMKRAIDRRRRRRGVARRRRVLHAPRRRGSGGGRARRRPRRRRARGGGGGGFGGFGGGFGGGGPRLPMTVELGAGQARRHVRADHRRRQPDRRRDRRSGAEGQRPARDRLRPARRPRHGAASGSPRSKTARCSSRSSRREASFEVSAATIRQREADLQAGADQSRSVAAISSSAS